METDVSLKVLSRSFTSDLLRLVHEEGLEVVSVDAVEIQDVRRQVDCLIKLQGEHGVHYRHFEFQSEPDPEMAKRCFRYNTQLVLQLDAPVLTTVVYLTPPGPKERTLAFRVALGGKEVNVWRFGEVRLWELSAEETLESRAVGLITLLPFMRGGRSGDALERAVGTIKVALPGRQSTEALALLAYFAGAYYNVEELTRVFGREIMIQSSLWQAAWNEGEAAGEAKGKAEGKAEGRAEGEAKGKAEGLRAVRAACLEAIATHHPALGDKAASAVATCDDHATLCRWMLRSAELDDEAFARLLGLS